MRHEGKPGIILKAQTIKRILLQGSFATAEPEPGDPNYVLRQDVVTGIENQMRKIAEYWGRRQAKAA